MVSPINTSVAGTAPAEAIEKKNNKALPENSGTAVSEVTGQPKPKLVQFAGNPKIENTDGEYADQAKDVWKKREIRKTNLDNGKLTINVYDSRGKLLRMIPPGYLPPGKQKFDVTV